MSVNLSPLPHFSSVEQYRAQKNAGGSVVEFSAPIPVTINGTYSNDPNPDMRALTGKPATAVAVANDKTGQPKFVLLKDSQEGGVRQFLFSALDPRSQDVASDANKA